MRLRNILMLTAALPAISAIYWWSLKPIAYASYRWFPFTDKPRLVTLYEAPSKWTAQRWPWYARVTNEHVGPSQWAGIFDRLKSHP